MGVDGADPLLPPLLGGLPGNQDRIFSGGIGVGGRKGGILGGLGGVVDGVEVEVVEEGPAGE